MYQCNITGKFFDLNDHEKTREDGIRFGYNCRFRAICFVLSKMLFHKVQILETIKEQKHIKGIGMSDSGWTEICRQKFDYVNTFYHQEPLLDIYNLEHVNQYSNLDFIISSEVFEHISPHPGIQYAFDHLYKMLKIGGFIVFSVPFSYEKHLEHYPSLHDYEIIKTNDNKYRLKNKTLQGHTEYFDDLVFHGGPGEVLEMRVFSKTSIIYHLEQSGFKDIKFYSIDQEMNQYGIFWSPENDNQCSLIISAKKVECTCSPYTRS